MNKARPSDYKTYGLSAGFSGVAMSEPDEPTYLRFRERFAAKSDQELIAEFNAQVGNNGWVRSRGFFLLALHAEFEKRALDYSDIGDVNGLSLRKKVKLVGQKIEVIAESESDQS